MKSSRFAERWRKRLGSRRSADAKPTQRLTGFEPLEPRTVLSAGLSHFASDDIAGHGPGASHGMGAYEKELHSTAHENHGQSGKSEGNERYVEATHYEPSQVVPPTVMSLSRDRSDSSQFGPIGRPAPEPTYALPSSILSEPQAGSEIEATRYPSAALSGGYNEESETESVLPSTLQSGLMARYEPDQVNYAAPSPAFRELSEEPSEAYEGPTYSAPAADLGALAGRPTIIDVSPAPTFANFGPKALSSTTEIFVVRTYDTIFAPATEARVVTAPAAVASAARLAADAIASATLNFVRSFVPMVVVVSPERRSEVPTSVSFTGLRESVSYVVSARVNGSLALSADAESASSKSTGLALASVINSLALNSSSSAQADTADRTTGVASRDDRQDGQAATEQADASDATGMIDVESAELLRQKRRASVENSLSRSKLTSRLEPLVDSPAIREAPLLLREIMQLASDAVMTNLHYELLPFATEMSDDGMIELLATDVASLFNSRRMPNIDAPTTAARAITLDAGVAVYQSFEVGAGDAAAAGGVDGNTAIGDAAPTPEQLARVE